MCFPTTWHGSKKLTVVCSPLPNLNRTYKPKKMPTVQLTLSNPWYGVEKNCLFPCSLLKMNRTKKLTHMPATVKVEVISTDHLGKVFLTKTNNISGKTSGPTGLLSNHAVSPCLLAKKNSSIVTSRRVREHIAPGASRNPSLEDCAFPTPLLKKTTPNAGKNTTRPLKEYALYFTISTQGNP